MHPNLQGQNTAILVLAGCFLATSARTIRWRYIPAVLLGAVFLYLTNSRLSIVAGTVAIIIYLILYRPTRHAPMAICVLSSGVCLLLLVSSFAASGGLLDVFFARRDEATNTLMERVRLWAVCFPYIEERLFLGYGFNAFWTPSHVTNVALNSGFAADHPHNTYLELLLGVGLVGALIYSLIVLGGAYQTFRSYRRSGNLVFAYLFSMFMFLLTTMTFETVLFDATLPSLLMHYDSVQARVF